jgi:putative heme degradation protein
MKTVKMEPNTKQFLTQEELGRTQAMHNEFNKLKSHLADVSLQKHGILKQIDLLRGDFSQHENELMTKYGNDAIINIQTGEITRKQKDGTD